MCGMGYFVTGLVAKLELLEAFAAQKSLHQPVAIGQGFALLPLRDEDIDSFIPSSLTDSVADFLYFTESLRTEFARASIGGDIVYFEADYFGGKGAQGAAVFSGGLLVYGPTSAATGPINEALRRLGVKVVAPAKDEFEALGLNRHRSTEDWLEVEK
jgi:hypothetical protein